MNQATLSGDEIEDDDLPTRYWCGRCDKPHMVADPDTHGHREHLYESREVAESDAEPLAERRDSGEDDDEDAAKKAGELFSIELSYSVTFSFRIPASDKHQAKRRAKDLRPRLNGATSAEHVHTRTDSIKEIFEDDDKLPEEWQIGDEPLYEVYGEEDTE